MYNTLRVTTQFNPSQGMLSQHPSQRARLTFIKGAPSTPLVPYGFLLSLLLVYHKKIILTEEETARVNKVFDLPASERNIPSVATEENLIKVKLLPKEVGTKVPWKKFVDGRAIGEKSKGAKRKRQESSDSDSDHADGIYHGAPSNVGAPLHACLCCLFSLIIVALAMLQLYLLYSFS